MRSSLSLRRRRALLPALVAVLLPLFPAVGAQAPSREAELEEIRAEIARLQARSLRLRDRETGLAGEIERTEVLVALQEKRVEEVRAQREIAEARVARSGERIAALEERLAASRAKLRKRVGELYRLGRDGPLRLLLSIRARQHLLPGIRLLRYLARTEAALVEEYTDARVRLSFERDQLLAHRREAARLLEQEGVRLEELRRTRKRQSLLLASVSRERVTVARRTEALVDKERKLEALLDQLFGRNPVPLAGTPMENYRGVLDWPIQGEVLAPFGPRLDPTYRTKVPHNGIDISTSRGGEVRVVFPGKVLFADEFPGFGPTAVVNHPSRVFTLYAGLQELRVARDDVLSLGQVVGLAGDRLYFEVRLENRPQDPLLWLR